MVFVLLFKVIIYSISPTTDFCEIFVGSFLDFAVNEKVFLSPAFTTFGDVIVNVKLLVSL